MEVAQSVRPNECMWKRQAGKDVPNIGDQV